MATMYVRLPSTAFYANVHVIGSKKVIWFSTSSKRKSEEATEEQYKDKRESRYHYEKKEDLPMPWIQCLWCDYRDKVERDLEWHFLEKHRKKLYRDIKITTYERKRAWRNDPFAFMYNPMDYRLEKAVVLAKKNSLALSRQEKQND